MDRVTQYTNILEQLIQEYCDLYHNIPDAQTIPIIDRTTNQYQLMQIGWDSHHRRIYISFHLSIQNEKIYIHSDPTEEGIANILMKRDIPPSDIVLEYRSPNLREHTPFATT